MIGVTSNRETGMRTINDFCGGTLIRAIRAKWDTLGNKDEIYMAAAAIEAIKEVLEVKVSSIAKPLTPNCPSCGSQTTDNTAFYLCQNLDCMKAWAPVRLSQPIRFQEVEIAGQSVIIEQQTIIATQQIAGKVDHEGDLTDGWWEKYPAEIARVAIEAQRGWNYWENKAREYEKELVHIQFAGNECECDICDRIAEKFRRIARNAESHDER